MKGLKSVATLRPFKLTLCSLRHDQLKAIQCTNLLLRFGMGSWHTWFQSH